LADSALRQLLASHLLLVGYLNILSACVRPHIFIAADAEASSPAAMVDAEVQVCLLQPSQQFALPEDVTALPGQLLQAAAEAVASDGTRSMLQDHVAFSQQAASVLAGLSSWLPQDMVAAAEAAAAAAIAAAPAIAPDQADAGDITAPGEAAAAGETAGDAEAAGKAATAAAAAALVGADLWREEARVASSVAGLAVQLEGTWGVVLDELEAAEVSAAQCNNNRTCTKHLSAAAAI
jgi:hypothetical protein